MHTVYKLHVSSLSFQLLAEVNGPEEADDSKIILVNSGVVFEMELALTCTKSHVIKRDRSCGLLHLDWLRHLI